MKKNQNFRYGFTLIEILATLAIILILAVASFKGVKNMRKRTADTTCIAHMKDLAQGVLNYYSDFEVYPNAGSYETYDDYDKVYYEHRGWVGWIRSNGKESLRKNSLWNYWYDDKRTEAADYYFGRDGRSHANDYVYVGTGVDCGNADEAEPILRSIREGAIFKYVKKNFANYSCPMFNDGNSKFAYRTYAMNRYFGGQASRLDGHRRERDFTNKNRNTMALFVEVASISNSGPTSGVNGNGAKNGKPIADDSVWDYENEDLGLWHDISGRPASHVVFADGHVESIMVNKDTKIRDLCNDLGNAEFKGMDQYQQE